MIAFCVFLIFTNVSVIISSVYHLQAIIMRPIQSRYHWLTFGYSDCYGDTGTSSTIRMDDYDRGHTRSPLIDTSLMTTSTIVNMNSSSIRDWAHSPITASIERSHAFSDSEARIHAPVFSQKQSRDQGHKKGFDVIIRSRDSPIDMRPLSVTSSTEFPTKYNSSSTTLTIKTPPNYTQNRHLSTQF